MKNVKQRMAEDMKLRGLAPRTQHRYLHTITALAEHYHRQPDQITERQVRKYLLYLIESKGYAKTTFNVDLCAIKFMYRRTLGHELGHYYLDDHRFKQVRGYRVRRGKDILSEDAKKFLQTDPNFSYYREGHGLGMAHQWIDFEPSNISKFYQKLSPKECLCPIS